MAPHDDHGIENNGQFQANPPILNIPISFPTGWAKVAGSLDPGNQIQEYPFAKSQSGCWEGKAQSGCKGQSGSWAGWSCKAANWWAKSQIGYDL